MLVVDDVRDHHVADVGVERGRLAEDVHAAQPGPVDRDLAQDVVGGDAERVVDVDDHRAARGQRVGVDWAEPRIERLGVERAERDDLGGHAQRGRAPQVGDAPLLLERAALGRGLRPAAR